MTEPTNSEILAAINALSARIPQGLEKRLTSVEKTTNETSATVNRIDVRLKSVEATLNEVSVATGVTSKAITLMRAEIEDLQSRVKKLEDA